MTTRQRSQQRRYALTAPRADILQQEVDDALAATPRERMEAAVALLDAAYDLWRTRGIADDEGLCRLPRCSQQRRRGLCSVGGMAVLSYIPYRTTRDLDVLIEPTPENAARARRAVGKWGGFEPATGHPEKDLPDVERLREIKSRGGKHR